MPEYQDMKDWTFYNPVRINAGVGIFEKLGQYIEHDGNILLVTTAGFTRRGLTGRVLEQFEANRVIVYDQVRPNPELDDLDQVTSEFKTSGINTIVAVGGGSVMDAAKVLSVTLTSELDSPLQQVLRDQKEYVWSSCIPVITVPTTSGTGAEVTPFATVWDTSTHKKHSVAGPRLFPRLTLLDAALTVSLPYEETLYTGLDAISQALESLWNKNRSPVSSAYAIQALTLAQEALPQVLSEGKNLKQREKMQQASLLAGLAISQTRTAIAHSISYPLTSHFGVPHGLACSFTLVEILQQYKDKISDVSHVKYLFDQIQVMLESFELSEKIAEYATLTQILACQHEMITKGRADNFLFDIDLETLLRRSCTIGVAP